MNRRDFLKQISYLTGGALLLPTGKYKDLVTSQNNDRLGRVNVGKVEVFLKPDVDSIVIGTLYEDTVVPVNHEVVGRNSYRNNQKFIETQDGYIWAPYLQPVKNIPNTPLISLPESSRGNGMWVEVSVPYVDIALENSPARSPWLIDRLEFNLSPRLYYSQVTWIDQIKVDGNNRVFYRINEPYGSYGDIFWGQADSFRVITEEEIAPINPNIENKRIVVNIAYQTLSCFEGEKEVFFCRISSGALWDAWGKSVDYWATPIGQFPIWRKLISLHMSGGSSGGGWDTPAVAWTSAFAGEGAAIHSTFWHNNFGEPMSHGCVNASPDDAKWIFRWSLPTIPLDPGDETIPWPGGTTVEVKEV